MCATLKGICQEMSTSSWGKLAARAWISGCLRQELASVPSPIPNLENGKHSMRADKILPLAKVLKMKAMELFELLEKAKEHSYGEAGAT